MVGGIGSSGNVVRFGLRMRQMVQQRSNAGMRGLHACCELDVFNAQRGALRAQFGILAAQCMGQRGQRFNFLCQVLEI